ncbi:MAG: hypothetical protein RI947_1179 [Candidatus Parcubacteria bacterium]|jgi:MoxR-like ATPase
MYTRQVKLHPSAADLVLVNTAVEKLKLIVKDLNEIFPEREFMLLQLMYALLTKEHTLIYGPHGTGKSDLLSTLFTAVTGAKIFAIGMSKFMPEGYIIGAADPTILKDTGKFYHRPEGTLIDCHFADLDEFFDANPALQRVMLGILNERKFIRGSQEENALLQTAAASTNAEPDVQVAQFPELAAVVDRFLFHSVAKYLSVEDNQVRMLRHYLEGTTPTTKMNLAELMTVSDIVVLSNQITDETFIRVYNKMIQAYADKLKSLNKKPLSDRRRCKLIQLAEADALVHGRLEVVLDDLYAVRYGLCVGGDETTYKAFDDVAKPVIEAAKKDAAQDVDKVQRELLLALKADIPAIPAQCSSGDLVDLAKALTAVRAKVDAVKPAVKTTDDQKAAILREIDAATKTVHGRIFS